MIQNIHYQKTNPASSAIFIRNLHKESIQQYYINPLNLNESIYAFNLKFNGNKINATEGKTYLNQLLPILDKLGITTLLVCSSEYFKFLTGVGKVEPYYGYVLPCKIKGYEHINCILSINYQALFYNPDLQSKLDLSLQTLKNHLLGSHKELGSDIIHSEAYPDTLEDIAMWLDKLHQYEALTVDLEAFSLSFDKAGIGTIAFAWDEHNGIAFQIDCLKHSKKNIPRRNVLRTFFENYKGTLIYHNIGYDGKVLCYELFMNNLLDQQGMLYGLEVMTRNIHDTKLITYLATNSCAGNTLGLKPNTHEFTGNYAMSDIHDIRLIPKQDLLRYNLIDTLATMYLFKKNYPKMIQDQQLKIYNTIFIPSIKVIMQMELTGLCLNMSRVLEVEKELSQIKDKALNTINNSIFTKQTEEQLTELAWIKDYEDRKSKAKNPDKILPKAIKKKVIFNPNSPNHLSTLLYDVLGLPITDTTETGLPATGADVIKKKKLQLMNKYDITKEDLC
jgi:DNA polymerase-1